MKNYNEKLIGRTQKVSQESLRKSKATVYNLTHPSKKVNRIGSVIGGSVGVGLLLVGATGVILGRSLWGVGSIIAGATTVTSNVININRNKE